MKEHIIRASKLLLAVTFLLTAIDQRSLTLAFDAGSLSWASLRPISAVDSLAGGPALAAASAATIGLRPPAIVQREYDGGYQVWTLEDEKGNTYKVTDYGANTVSLVVDGQERLYHATNGETVYDPKTNRAVTGGMPFMFPWTSRVKNGILTLANGEPVDLKECKFSRQVPGQDDINNVLHGATDKIKWKLVKGNKGSITLSARLRDVPIGPITLPSGRIITNLADIFGDVEVEITYSLEDGCFKQDVQVTNLSKTDVAQLSFGFHPFYRLDKNFAGWYGHVDADKFIKADKFQVPENIPPQDVALDSRLDLRGKQPLFTGTYENGLTALYAGGEGEHTVLSTLTNSDGRAIIVRQDGEIYQHVMFWTSDKIAADVMIGSIQPTTSSADARNGERAKREGVALVEIAVDGSGNNVARASSSVTFSPATESVLRDLITTTNYQAEFLDTVKRTRDLGHGLVSMSVTYKGKIFIIDNGADTFIELNDITATDRDRLTHLAAHRKNPNIPVLMISHPHDEIHELIRQGVPIGPLSPDHVVLTQERGELVVVANVEDIRFPERVATSLKEHNLVLTEEGAVVAAGSHDLEAAYAIWMAAETAKTMVAGLVAGSGQPLLSLTTRQVDALMGSGYEKERSGRMKVRRSKPLVKSGPTDVLRIERASDPNNERVIEETWRLRAELVRGGQGLAAGNLVVGPGGNISVRLHSNPNIVLIKAKGSAFESMEADEYVAVDLETGKPIEMDGLGPAYSPSTETTIHLAVYREHPGTYAVCHTHPSLATGIATAGQTFAVRGIPCQRFDFLEPGSPLFASSVAGAIGKGAVLIANHGIFTMGITLGEAIDHNFSVEYAAGEIVLHRPWAATTTGFSAAAVASAQMV